MRLPCKWIVVLAGLNFVVGSAAQETFTELLSQGEALARQGKYQSSVAKLEAAKAQQPGDYRVNLLLGTVLLRMGRAESALAPLRSAAEDSSDNGSAAANLAAANLAIGAFGPAAEAFQRSLFRAPHSEEFLAKWGDFSLERFRTLQTQMQASQSGMAALLRFQAERSATGMRAELLERSALADPQQPGIWGELGVENLKNGHTERAKEYLLAAQKQKPQDLGTIRLQALLASQQGNWGEAETALAEIAERSPAVFLRAAKEWPARLLPPDAVPGKLWDCLRHPVSTCGVELRHPQSQPDHNPATLFTQQRWEELAAEGAPQDGEASGKYRSGVAWAELQVLPRAIPLLEDGLDAGQERAAFLLLACYSATAKDAADRLAASNFTLSAHRLRGDFFIRVENDPASAIAEYQQAIRSQPREAALQERLAQAYWSEKRVSEARNTAEMAIALQPNRPVALRLLASIAMEERNYGAAQESLNKLLALSPRDSWAKVQLGIASAQTGQFDRAVDLLQREIALGYPDERGAIHAILARALWKLGRNAEAAEAEASAARLADAFQQGVEKASDDLH